MTYSPENTSVILKDHNGKEHHITGFAEADLKFEQQWWKLVRVEEDGTHLVECRDNDFKLWIVPMTKEGYDKHIKDLKPSVNSPFKFTKAD